ncbi:hypothetical protein HZC07_06060 [Candidatus Micrarchaeota archaeon]|nr:hypothetical protein [Candidatus Micrarchaeota archaeon]
MILRPNHLRSIPGRMDITTALSRTHPIIEPSSRAPLIAALLAVALIGASAVCDLRNHAAKENQKTAAQAYQGGYFDGLLATQIRSK